MGVRVAVRLASQQPAGGLQSVVHLGVGVPDAPAGQPAHLRREPTVRPDRVEGGQVVAATDLPVDLAEGRGQVHDAGPLVGFDEVPGHHLPTVLPGAAGRGNQVFERPLVVQADQVAAGQASADTGTVAEHRLHQVGGHDGVVHHGVLEVRTHRYAGVGQQSPRRGRPQHERQPGQGGPAEGPPQAFGGRALVGEMHEDVGGFVDDLLVDIGLSQLMTREGRPATRAVGHHLDVLVEQPFVPEALQVPPHRLDVLGGERPIGVVDVDPVADALGQRLPVVHVVAHRLAAQPGELGHADPLLDLALVGDPQLLLDLDLDRQAVGVPTGLARHGEAAHGAVPTEQVLVHPGPDVVQPGPPVGGGRALVEDPRLGVPPGLDGALEDPVLPPSGQLLGFEHGEVGFGWYRGEQRRSSSRVAVTVGTVGARPERRTAGSGAGPTAA